MKKIVSKALIMNSSGLLLFLYRSDTHPNFPGHLDLPGGEIEARESYRQATSREILEETGLSIPLSCLKRAFTKERGDATHVLFTAFLPDDRHAITTSWEHKGYIWISRTDLLNTHIPERVDLYYADVIEYLRRPTSP